MAYIGPLPAETFTSFATQEFSTSATTSYTLNHPVTNENELALFINNVRQQPGSGKAYTATGTALTLSEATASTDTMYAVFLGRALQTVNPAGGSVGSSEIAAEMITGQTELASEPADTDEFLISDAGTLKRIDYSLIKGGGMWEFISQTNVTSSTAQVDFTSFSTDYTDFCVIVDNAIGASDNLELSLRYFDSDGNIETDSSYMYSHDGSEQTAEQQDSQGDSRLRIGRSVGNATGEHGCYEIIIYNPHDTVLWTMTQYVQVYSNGAGEFGQIRGGGFSKINNGGNYKATGVRIYFNSGNISSGKFSLYGRKHS